MPYKKGDRIQHIETGIFGTIHKDQTDLSLVDLCWDKTPNVVECFKHDAVRIAPWHEVSVIAFMGVDPYPRSADADGKLYGSAVKADAADLCKYRAGDRVKLKYNRSCGTVVKVSTNGWQVSVQWDKRADDPAWENVKDLVTLYAPRDTDPVNPNQEAIDAIEVQRKALIKEVDAVQARLRTLTMAKKLLERG